jgi:hypothetical protein
LRKFLDLSGVNEGVFLTFSLPAAAGTQTLNLGMMRLVLNHCAEAAGILEKFLISTV